MLLSLEELDEINHKTSMTNHRFLFSDDTKQPGPNHLINFFHPMR
jgi:hypothetical protein